MTTITIHPIMVHFPIALIALALLFEMAFYWKREEFYHKAALLSFYAGTLGAVLAVISGLMASDAMGHDAPFHDLVHDHSFIMYIVLALCIAAALAFHFISYLKSKKGSKLFIITLFLINSLLVYGAHLGGQLVYDKGIGTKPMMEKWKTEHHESGAEHSH